MTTVTHVLIAALVVLVSLAIWLVGIWIQWKIGLRDIPQFITMLLNLALPVVVAPVVVRFMVALFRADASLLGSAAIAWYGLSLVTLGGLMTGLLNLGADEGRVGAFALVGLGVAAVVATYGGSRP